MRIRRVLFTLALPILAVALAFLPAACKRSPSSTAPPVTNPHVVGNSKVDIGRYIVTVSGCNDCHTPGGLEGRLPQETEWLTGGDKIGFVGPWGTSYAPNLRLKIRGFPTEESYVKTMKARAKNPAEARGPMPWGSFAAMSDEDLGAIWHYTRSLGEKGEAMPEPLPPGVAPYGPVIDMVPKMGRGQPPRIGAPNLP